MDRVMRRKFHQGEISEAEYEEYCEKSCDREQEIDLSLYDFI